MNKSCFIDDCSKYKEKNTSFHRFPTDRDLCNSWCQSMQTFNNQQNAFKFHRNSYVCGHHFRNSDKYVSGKKTILHKNVIPSIYPRCCEKESELCDESMEIEKDSSDASCADISVPTKNYEYSCISSDGEDFLGFEAEDLTYGIVKSSTGFTEMENVNRDLIVVENVVKSENDTSSSDPSDCKEVDDEIIFVENSVEVIEIDDDSDSELPEAVQIKIDRTYSRYDIQHMLISNNPQIQLRKPKLDWKSDQFRLVYINGVKQNLCTCTKCWELFEEINIDIVVRHAKCNPTPNVSPCAKRRKLNDQQENTAVQQMASETFVQHLTISKIQTIAASMDVQTSTFYQGKRFLNFAQFLIDVGASMNKNELFYEPSNDDLCSYRDRVKGNQLSKILSILNTPNNDFSLSCEIWEDSFRRKTNVSLELHYLDANYQRHRTVIGVRSMNDINVDDTGVCEQIVKMLRTYSTKNDGTEFLQRATAFVTSRKLDTQSLTIVSFPSACSIINRIADEIVNEERLKIADKCLHVIGWLNSVSREKITVFDARKWENIFELFRKFSNIKASFIQRAVESPFPQDHSILQLLEPFHNAIADLSEAKNNITKVFGICKSLESSLMPHECDPEIVQFGKGKAVESLRAAFADSDAYQICMFLDPSNRDLYNSLESDKMDSLQSKIDNMINPYMSTKANGCIDNDLIHYMDDNVKSQPNQIDLFLQWMIPSKDDPYEFWRGNVQMPGLKALAKKYFTIPTYVSLSECKFSKYAKEFLMKRSTVETKDLETMLMLNSSQCRRTNKCK